MYASTFGSSRTNIESAAVAAQLGVLDLTVAMRAVFRVSSIDNKSVETR